MRAAVRSLVRRSRPEPPPDPSALLTANRTASGRRLELEPGQPTPLVAAIDSPPDHELETPSHGMCRFSGWVVSRAGRDTRVIATIGKERREVPADRERRDVVAALGDEFPVNGARCGFVFHVEVPEGATKPLPVTLELTDGEHSIVLPRYLVRRGNVPAPARAEYKAVWNEVSGDVESAKLAVAGYTDEGEFGRMADASVAVLERTVGLHAEDVVLEIGAGVGRVGPAIAPLVKQWIATDVSENMLTHARERCTGLDNVSFVPISGWDLSPIASESIDVVYCTVVFMHLDEWDRYNYIREAMRVLRPGGRLYVDNVNLLGDDGWAFFVNTADNYHPIDRPANISKSSTPEELRTYFERAGLQDITVETSSMWTWAYGTKP